MKISLDCFEKFMCVLDLELKLILKNLHTCKTPDEFNHFLNSITKKPNDIN